MAKFAAMRICFGHKAVLSLAAALCGALLPGTSSGGAFHLRLTRSEPAVNDSITVAPTELKLWFSEEPQLAITRVTLVGERGDTIGLAPLTHSRGTANPVVAAITGRVVSGRYSVFWRAASADGHAQSGNLSFVIRPPRAASRIR